MHQSQRQHLKIVDKLVLTEFLSNETSVVISSRLCKCQRPYKKPQISESLLSKGKRATSTIHLK